MSCNSSYPVFPNINSYNRNHNNSLSFLKQLKIYLKLSIIIIKKTYYQLICDLKIMI